MQCIAWCVDASCQCCSSLEWIFNKQLMASRLHPLLVLPATDCPVRRNPSVCSLPPPLLQARERAQLEAQRKEEEVVALEVGVCWHTLQPLLPLRCMQAAVTGTCRLPASATLCTQAAPPTPHQPPSPSMECAGSIEAGGGCADGLQG